VRRLHEHTPPPALAPTPLFLLAPAPRFLLAPAPFCRFALDSLQCLLTETLPPTVVLLLSPAPLCRFAPVSLQRLLAETVYPIAVLFLSPTQVVLMLPFPILHHPPLLVALLQEVDVGPDEKRVRLTLADALGLRTAFLGLAEHLLLLAEVDVLNGRGGPLVNAAVRVAHVIIDLGGGEDTHALPAKVGAASTDEARSGEVPGS
jgi:hypothetical protein